MRLPDARAGRVLQATKGAAYRRHRQDRMAPCHPIGHSDDTPDCGAQGTSGQKLMRHLIAATLMATALGTGAALPAAAQTAYWTGSKLIVTPRPNCRVEVDHAYLQGSGWSASIHLVFRNRGAELTGVNVQVELQGNGQSKSGAFGPYRINPGAASDQATLSPYGGSLAGSTLRVRFTACSTSY